MIFKRDRFCIASSTFPLKFYKDGYEAELFDDGVLRNYDDCQKELQTYDNLEPYQILNIKVTYEL